MINFGMGQLFITGSGATPTPVQVGTLQDVSLDISRDIKELVGSKAFAEDVALGKGKISGKFKSGRLNAGLLAAVLAGSTTSTGQTAGAYNETSTIPATPYQVTVVNSATFKEDGGVYDKTAGIWMTRVASAPATGQYSVAAGVYTFAVADTTHVVGIYYTYTKTTGNDVKLTNPLMGAAVTFTMNVFNTYKGKDQGYKLYAVVIPKLAITSKNDDYTMTDMDFTAYADGSDQIIDYYVAD